MSKIAEAMEHYEIYLDTKSTDEAIELLTDAGFVMIEYDSDIPIIYGLMDFYGLTDPVDIFTDIRKYPANMDKDNSSDPFYKPFIYVW